MMKKIINKLRDKYKNLKTIYKIIICFFLITGILGGWSLAGWMGYYEMQKPAEYKMKIGYSSVGYVQNIAVIKFSEKDFIYLELPMNCSGFIVAGIITPFTPPIPIPNFRSITFGENNHCNYFGVHASSPVKVTLKYKDNFYSPQNPDSKEMFYIFPVKVRNLDTGSVVIEKNGQVVEVPFNYKFIRFWY